MEAYHAPPGAAISDYPSWATAKESTDRSQPVPALRNYRAVRNAVPLSEYAGRLTKLEPRGDRLKGRCPLPDHDDRTASFVVYADDHYHCFGCEGHGDVIDLHQAVGGFEESWQALVDLSVVYGVDLPGRPARWHEHQAKKAKVLDVASETKKRVYRMRLFKVAVKPDLEEALKDEDEDTARRVLEAAWLDFCAGLEKWGL